jgi:predicted ArsR family transcriptional regulator
LEKYPNEGKLNLCKKCLTMHIDNWNPETYLWILQEVDVPYIPDEWNKLMQSYAQNKKKLTGTTILGRYLAKMKLKQFKEYRWADTDFLQELANNKIEQAMKKQGYGAAEIAAVIERGAIPPLDESMRPGPEDDPNLATGNEDYFTEINGGEDDFIDDLTDEDRTYLRLKWGRTYRPEEWIKLEQLYEEMMASYDIQSAGDKNTLILVCKSSLKANQLFDIGDMEGAQKATKMYDALMKAGKWTAAQNKTDDSEVVDSIGELVEMCERQGFIPRYYVAGPQDHADRVIEDLQKYTHDLIDNESGLSSLIEVALKQIQEENELIHQAGLEDEEDDSEAKLFDYDNMEHLLETADYEEFSDYEFDLKNADDAFLKEFLEAGGDE